MRERLRARRPEFPVELAFLERMEPTLEGAVDTLATRGVSAITVFPIFMAQGGHLKHDLPRMIEAIRAKHPRVPIALASAVGEVPEIVEAIADWVLRSVD
ncbi:MAG: CbiX/SirB N-terminal domain-containing protein [Betaproteobacteria bacterium]|nr:CbiX/SirB N-terminal domain-containing protein [Betaproteobacteria bacterium]